MDNLTILRKKINKLDEEIIDLLANRIKVIEQVGIHKKQYNIPPLDTIRWKQVLDSRIELGKKSGLSEKLITDIFEAIHTEALAIEDKIIHEK